MNLTAREKIGQRIVVGFPGTEIESELENLVMEYKIGNFILFKHNIESASQVEGLCKRLQRLAIEATGYPAFITIDQEGGMVTRLKEDCVNIPGAMAIAATGKIEHAKSAGKITGEQLRSLGINFNLAPVADINSNADNPVIGIRSYGDEPQAVAKYCVAMLKGLLEGGVLAAAKHFPGHGDTNVDSHLGLPKVNKTLEELSKSELIPFQAAIEAGVSAIMTSHILFPELESKQIPATMSRSIITGLLKEKMGFQGLIISDCMEMNAIKKYYGTIEGCKLAVMAGVDMIFISHTQSNARDVSQALTKALETGEISEQEMNYSVDKILRYKERLLSLPERNHSIEEKFDVVGGQMLTKALRKESLTAVQMPTGQLPQIDAATLFVGCAPFRATNVSNIEDHSFHFPGYMAKQFNAQGILISPNPEQEEMERVLSQAEEASAVVIGTYNGHLNKGQLELVAKVAKVNSKIIVIALRNPYDLRNLPEEVYGIAAYEYTMDSLEVLRELFEQPFEMKGSLPIRM